jgi:hypothetical protein
VHSAIAHYEQEMRARAAEVGQLTLDQTASMHSANALADLLGMFS